MFNKDFLFSAIKRIFAGDPIKFKFYLSIIQYCCLAIYLYMPYNLLS